MSAGTASAKAPSAAVVAVAVEEDPVSVIVTPGTGTPAPSRTTPANRNMPACVRPMLTVRSPVTWTVGGVAVRSPESGVGWNVKS